MKAEAASTPAPPRLPAPSDKPGRNAAPLALTTLAGRFAAQLEKQGQATDKPGDKLGGQSIDAARTAGLRGDEKPLTARDGEDSGQGQGSGPAAGAVPSLAPTAPVRPAAGEVALPDTALLDRIAAQIAEPHGLRGAEAVQLALPPGSLAAGALVARGPDGGLAIRITGMDPRLAPAQTLRLRSGLERALARRGVEVTALELEPAQTTKDYRADKGYRGRASVTSRTA